MGALISCVALNLCECAFCMACGCCTGIFNATLSQMARFGHLVVYILIFVLSIVMGRHFQQNIVAESSYTYYVVDVSDSLNIASLYDGCNKDYYEECVFRQLVDDVVDRVMRSVHDIENAIRQAGFLEQSREEQRGGRGAL